MDILASKDTSAKMNCIASSYALYKQVFRRRAIMFVIEFNASCGNYCCIVDKIVPEDFIWLELQGFEVEEHCNDSVFKYIIQW
jgi:hypothetical protein